MCWICGDMNHFDNSFLEKAIKETKAKKESHAHYPVQAKLEAEFKNNFKNTLIKTNTQILKIITDEQF